MVLLVFQEERGLVVLDLGRFRELMYTQSPSLPTFDLLRRFAHPRHKNSTSADSAS